MTDTRALPTALPTAAPSDFHYKYTVLPGLFMQSESSTDDSTFDFKSNHFGLIPRTYPTDAPDSTEPQWTRFAAYIAHLRAQDPSIKVLFLGRHGQGWHNVAESKYGTKAWDCYYSALSGHDGLTWSDAHLTPTGGQQARDANVLWKQELERGLPVPDVFYVSPLTRTIETADLTFAGLDVGYAPYIVELLREALGIHTCDRRSPLSHLTTAFPHLTFEPNFSDPDPLWKSDYREPSSARRYRLATFLDAMWERPGTWVSATSHSGAIASVLEVLGHRAWALETGGVVPVVVAAERVEGRREVPEWEPSDSGDMCEGPPGEA